MKRNVYDAVMRSEAGFQPTYEELKPDAAPGYDHREDRFQPTYEELKHILFAGTGFVNAEFSAYLRGIET